MVPRPSWFFEPQMIIQNESAIIIRSENKYKCQGKPLIMLYTSNEEQPKLPKSVQLKEAIYMEASIKIFIPQIQTSDLPILKIGGKGVLLYKVIV